MTTLTHRSRLDAADRAGSLAARYGLVVVIAWIGALKFTAYEAEGIMGLVADSPLMGWVYDIVSVRTFSAALGVLELTVAALIAVKPGGQGFRGGQRSRRGAVRQHVELPVHHPRGAGGIGRIRGAVLDRPVLDQRRCLAGHLRVDARRRAAGFPGVTCRVTISQK